MATFLTCRDLERVQDGMVPEGVVSYRTASCPCGNRVARAVDLGSGGGSAGFTR